jgi:hypothetical protein
MTEPNIVNVSAIKSFFLSWDVFLGKNVLLTNADNSNQIFKVTDIKLSNFDAETAGMVTVVLNRNEAEYAIIKNVMVQPNATISVVTAETEIILEEGDRIVVYSEEENQSLSTSISYLVVSETTADHNRSIFSLVTPPTIGTDELLTLDFISRNIPNGNISYEITGVNTEDIDNFPLSGTFNVVDGLAQIQFEVKESAENKTIVFSIPSLSASVSIEVSGTLYDFTAFTFTNGGTLGRLGPTKQSLLSVYNTVVNPWLLEDNFYDLPQFNGYQLWTVPKNGNYNFVVNGASRGSAQSKGAAARITATVPLAVGQKIWIVCGQQGLTNSEIGDGASWVVLSNNGQIEGSTPLIVAGGAGDYSFYSSESSFQTGQSFSNAQTTDNLDASVLGVSISPSNPITGNGGTVFQQSTASGFVTGGGGFNTNGEFFSGGNTQGSGLSFFNGLYGGLHQNNTFNTTTTAGGGFGGGGARSGGFGTGGGGGYTGGAASGGNSPSLRRSTGGSSYVTQSALNVVRELASSSAPSATAQQGFVQITFID